MLKAYDKNLRRTGLLVDAADVQRKRRLNSDYELSFLVPMTSDDYREKIQLKGHLQDERGQYYVIDSRQRVRDGKKLTSQITATHVMFRLNDFKIPYDSYIDEAYGVQIQQLLNVISAASYGKFTFVTHDTFELRDVKDFGRTTALAALNQVVELYGCEVEPDNFTIHLKKRVGADRGMQYRIQKNIINNQFKDNGANLVTRMYAQMKDGRTFVGLPTTHLTAEELSLLQSVPGAIENGKVMVNYLISPYAQYWANNVTTFYDGEFVDQNIEDPVELLQAAREALKKNEVPELDISINAADLHKIDDFEEPAQLGDTVYLYDPDMELNNITARVVEMTEYPLSKDKHSQVTVANYLVRDYIDIIADLEKSKQILDTLLSGGKIRTEAFETFAKQAIKDIDNSKTELIYPPEGGILAQDKANPLNQVRLTATGLGVSTDGWKTVRSAITARGIVAETIVGQLGSFVTMLIGSGDNVTQINTNGIAAGNRNFNSAPFRVGMNGHVVARSIELTGQIENSQMESSTITGGLIRTAASGARVELDSRGWRTYDAAGRERISIDANDYYGMSGISFNTSGGGGAGTINGGDTLFSVLSGNDMMISALSGTIYFQGRVSFQDASLSGISIASISGLSSELNKKADKGVNTGSVTGGSHNHGIPDGTQFKDVTGKTWTWTSYSGFTHSHSI